MATLAQGSSVTVSLAARSTLITFGAGSAVIGPGNQYGQSRSIYNQSSVGPFPQDVVVYLTATTSSIEYYSLATGESLINALPSFTWAGRPSASIVGAGVLIRVSDIGLSPGIAMVSDGTEWRPNGVTVLGRQNTQVVAPADTNENTLYSLTVPGNVIGQNGSLRVWYKTSITNNANLKTIRLRFGGQVWCALTLGAQDWAIQAQTLSNRNSLSAQLAGVTSPVPFGAISGNVVFQLSVNTAVDQPLIFTAQKATAGDAVNLESILVELLP